MEKIGIFGGTFDPIHNEHLNIAHSAIKEFCLDKLVIVPTYLSPFKLKGNACTDEQRYQMVRLAFEGMKKVEVSRLELDKECVSYTYLTLRHFKALYPEAELYFILGGDSLESIEKWRCVDEIVQLCRLVVAEREGYPVSDAVREQFEQKHGKPVERLRYCGQNVSSTEARVIVEFGLPVGNIMPNEVANYIRAHHLYENYAELVQRLKMFLPEKRFKHTAYVVAESLMLASRVGEDRDKTFLAAALHDIAKKLTREQLDGFGYVYPKSMPEPVVHAFAGAYLAETVFQVTDADILAAIRYHTTGRVGMSLLEKIIYVADCIEKTRDYEPLDKLRKAVAFDFEQGFLACLKGTIELLDRSGDREAVSSLTQEAYAYYCDKA